MKIVSALWKLEVQMTTILEDYHTQHCWTQRKVLNGSIDCLQAAAVLFDEAAAVNPNDARTFQKGLLERRMGEYEAARR